MNIYMHMTLPDSTDVEGKYYLTISGRLSCNTYGCWWDTLLEYK